MTELIVKLLFTLIVVLIPVAIILGASGFVGAAVVCVAVMGFSFLTVMLIMMWTF